MTGKYPPITGFRLALLTLGVSLAVFMNILDTSIANVAIPTIAGDLAISPNQGTWVITSFTVTLAIAVPLTGWLARTFGEVRLFLWATTLFSIFSLLCGLAPNLGSLVFLRVLQGVTAGPMIPLSQSLLMSNYPKEKHGTALSIWSMTAVVAPVVGPLLGGWITDNYSWPWVFYINVPVGALAVWLTWSTLRGRETDKVKTPIDRVGLGLLIVGVAALQIMLDKGNELNWFSSGTVWTLALVALVGLSALVVWELTDAHPVVDLSLLKSRRYTLPVLALTFGYLTYFANVVVFPLWLQTQMGYTATDAGIAAAPIGVLAVVVAPFMGKLMQRFDPRWLVTISFTVFAAVSFWTVHFDTDVTLAQLAWPRFVYGAAMPLFFVPLMTMALSGVQPQKIASASGLFNFLRMLGAGFGASLGISLWDNRQALHDARISETVSAANLAHVAVPGLDAAQRTAEVAGAVMRQSFMQATDDFAWISGWIFAALIALVWIGGRKKAAGGAAPVGAADAGH